MNCGPSQIADRRRKVGSDLGPYDNQVGQMRILPNRREIPEVEQGEAKSEFQCATDRADWHSRRPRGPRRSGLVCRAPPALWSSLPSPHNPGRGGEICVFRRHAEGAPASGLMGLESSLDAVRAECPLPGKQPTGNFDPLQTSVSRSSRRLRGILDNIDCYGNALCSEAQ